MVEIEDIRGARERIGPHVHRTPLIRSAFLDRALGAEVGLKLESLQKTGSFKPRGAMNRLLGMSEEERERGIATVSAGNHAQAAAYACSRQSIPCVVVMPASAPRAKIEATRDYGATVVLHNDMRTLFDRLEEVRRERDATFLHPFDDPAVIAGAGTVGLEIHEDFPGVELVVSGVGGGGLISGTARAVRRLDSRIRVIGVEPEGAPTVTRALEAGEPVRLERIDSIADGLSAPFAGARNLEIIREEVERVVLVPDAEILSALRVLFERTKLVVEPAGAAALGALLSGRFDVRGRKVAVVISGGNVDLTRLGSWFER